MSFKQILSKYISLGNPSICLLTVCGPESEAWESLVALGGGGCSFILSLRVWVTSLLCFWLVFMKMFPMGILHTVLMQPHRFISIYTTLTLTQTHTHRHTHYCTQFRWLFPLLAPQRLKAVTCWRIETNQRCHCVAWSRLGWSLLCCLYF